MNTTYLKILLFLSKQNFGPLDQHSPIPPINNSIIDRNNFMLISMSSSYIASIYVVCLFGSFFFETGPMLDVDSPSSCLRLWNARLMGTSRSCFIFLFKGPYFTEKKFRIYPFCWFQKKNKISTNLQKSLKDSKLKLDKASLTLHMTWPLCLLNFQSSNSFASEHLCIWAK